MNINVSLPIELADFIEAEVSAGHYASSSAVVRAALRLMAQVERQDSERLRDLRELWAQGIDSGDEGEVDFAALKREARARIS